MIFVRKGPRYLFLYSPDISLLQEFLVEKLAGKFTELSEALEISRENDTIVFISDTSGKDSRIKALKHIVYLPGRQVNVMGEIINHGIAGNIAQVDFGAGQMVMRLPQEGEKIIEKIREKYLARSVDLATAIREGLADDSILSFTEIPIRDKVRSLALIKETLLISRPVDLLRQELRRDAVRYITQALKQEQWYELKINIYDSHDQYELQYQRLSLTIADLEAGFILGESWTRDHAIALLSVIAYQVRLFTFLPPEEIKSILLGLEYTDQGKRIVDYDLYYNNKKINWYKVTGKRRNIDRVNLAIELHQKLMKNLSVETRESLKTMEEKLS